MRIEFARQTGHPVPQFVVHAENEVESMLLEDVVAYARRSERPVKFHLHGLTSTNGRPTSFNFGYVFEDYKPKGGAGEPDPDDGA